MLDKQLYRNLQEVTPADLERVLANYETVAELVGTFPVARPGMVAVIADGPAAVAGLDGAIRALGQFGLTVLRRVVSSELMPAFVVQTAQQLDATFARLIYVASGPQLAAMLAAATPNPVFDASDASAEDVAAACAKALALDDTVLFGRVMLVQGHARSAVLQADAQLNAPRAAPQGANLA